MHPILLAIGKFYIGTYGLFVAAGLVCGAMVAVWRAKRVGVRGDDFMDVLFWCILIGLAGARLTHIAVSLLRGDGDYLSHPLQMLVSRTGFVFLGGVIAALAASVVIVRRKKLNFWLLGDIAMASMPLGHAFGRAGCFMAGCCYGRLAPTEGPLAFLGVRYPAVSEMGQAVYPGMAFADHYKQGLLDAGASLSLPVLPTQLFETAGNLLLFAVLMFLWRRRRFNGQIFLSYFGLYAVLRFSLEFLRGDAERGAIGFLSTSQSISVVAFVGAIVGWIYLRNRQDLQRVAVTERQVETQRHREERNGVRRKGKKSAP